MNPDELVEDALRTYPLEDVPPGFRGRIMQRITAPDARTTLRFRLTWMDYALGFFLALFPSMGLTLWAFLPRQFLLQLQLQMQLFQAVGGAPVLAILLLIVGAMLLGGFLFSLDLLLRPRLALK